jgi:hypothetical protein
MAVPVHFATISRRCIGFLKKRPSDSGLIVIVAGGSIFAAVTASDASLSDIPSGVTPVPFLVLSSDFVMPVSLTAAVSSSSRATAPGTRIFSYASETVDEPLVTCRPRNFANDITQSPRVAGQEAVVVAAKGEPSTKTLLV